MAEDQNLGNEAVDDGGSDALDWVPDKFKSNPQELAKAYENLEREYHNSRQQVKGLEDSIEHLSSQFEAFTTQQNQPDPNEVRSQWEQAYEMDPWNTIQAVVQQTAQTVREELAQQNQSPQVSPEIVAFMADQNLAAQHGDWGEYKQQVAELVQNDPLFANDSLWSNPALATQALGRAYDMVKAQSVLSGNAVVQQQMADTRQMKLQAQSASGAAGRPDSPDENAQRWSEIMNAQTGKLEF